MGWEQVKLRPTEEEMLSCLILDSKERIWRMSSEPCLLLGADIAEYVEI